MKYLKKLFKYLEPLWTGVDGRISLRACLAIFLSWKLVQNLDYVIMKWGSDRPIAGVDSNLLILAGLIAALLSLSTWQNSQDKRTDALASNPPLPDNIVKVENVENLSTASNNTTKIDTPKVENITSENTTITQN